jgi:MFS family permease
MNLFPLISDRFGRRWCMISYWIVIAAGCACESGARDWRVWVSRVLFTVANGSINVLQLLAKMFVGLGVGALQVTMQCYLTEMSPTSKIRGAMLSCYNFWFVFLSSFPSS